MERRTIAHAAAAGLLGVALILAIIGIARWDGTNPLIPADAELGPLPEFELKPSKLDAATVEVGSDAEDATVTAQFESSESSVCADESDSLPDALDAHDADSE